MRKTTLRTLTLTTLFALPALAQENPMVGGAPMFAARAVLAAFGAPLWLAAVPGDDGAPLRDAAAVAARLGAHDALVVDDGPSSSSFATPGTHNAEYLLSSSSWS